MVEIGPFLKLVRNRTSGPISDQPGHSALGGNPDAGTTSFIIGGAGHHLAPPHVRP